MEWVLFVLLFIAFFVGVLAFILTPVFKDKKISNNVMNKDSYWRNYLFKVKYAKQEIIGLLKVDNAFDVLGHVFDVKTMTISFHEYGNPANISYTVHIKEFDGGSYIKLTKNTLFGSKSNVPFKINEFMIKNLGAELLPYEEYKNIVE